MWISPLGKESRYKAKHELRKNVPFFYLLYFELFKPFFPELVKRFKGDFGKIPSLAP